MLTSGAVRWCGIAGARIEFIFAAKRALCLLWIFETLSARAHEKSIRRRIVLPSVGSLNSRGRDHDDWGSRWANTIGRLISCRQSASCRR